MVLQVDQQCGIGWALVEQPSLENRVQVGAARRLHQSPPRHRRGAKSGAAARRRAVMAMFIGEITIERWALRPSRHAIGFG